MNRGGMANPMGQNKAPSSNAVKGLTGSYTLMDIACLNTYSPMDWAIKGKITTKTQLKEYTNAKGKGTRFSIIIQDKNGVEIEGAFFGEAANKWSQELNEGNV